MPTYLDECEVDWGWKGLNEAERTIVRCHEARLQADPRSHTVVTAKEALAAASRELPGRVVLARASDEDGVYGWRGFNGAVSKADAFDEAGKFPDELTADDYRAAGVTKIVTALFFPEGMLDAMITRAAELDVSLSAFVQGAWQRAGSLTGAPPSSLGPKRMQSVHLPVAMWAEIRTRAASEDRSMSFFVQRAVAAMIAT